MTEHGKRSALWFAALAISVPLIFKGHIISRKRDDVAFLPEGVSSPGSMTVKLSGNCVKSGFYRFENSLSVGTVINMTVRDSASRCIANNLKYLQLQSGDAVLLSGEVGKEIEIIVEKMNVKEELILGISVDPNRMTADDWESLPGIGPTTAGKIISYRQNNGGFASIQDLRRVPGIGDIRLKQIEQKLNMGLMY